VSERYARELEYAVAAAEWARDLLREAFRAGYQEKTDRAAEERIHDVLTTAFPIYGYRGEELGLRLQPRDRQQHLWLVDPSDGTSAAVAGYRGAAVSIALLREGIPVLGVVYAYSAPDDLGDLFQWAEGSGPVRRNGREVLRTWPEVPGTKNTVLVSHHADRNPVINAELVHPMRYRAVAGLAYRLALVAAGEGDVAVSINSPVGWDYAAGHALLTGAGGDLYDTQGWTLTYDVTGQGGCGGVCLGGPRTLIDPIMARDWQKALCSPVNAPGTHKLCAPLPGRTVTNPGLLRRAQGCLVGQIAGDALGSLVEFQGPSTIRAKYSDGPRRLEDGGTWNTIAGQPTDDSEMALSLARTILDKGRYDVEKVARSYARWFKSPPFDWGGTTEKALSVAVACLNSGQSVANATSSAASRTSQANGALMRISPLGILGAALKPEKVVELARQDAGLTHPNVVSRDASAVFAVALSLAIRQGYGPTGTMHQTMELAERVGVCEPVQRCLRDAQTQPPSDYLTEAGWVLVALQNAFYQMLRAESFEQGIVDTVRRGGDTDTNAAIAGALLGAICGREAVPAQWVDRVLTCRPLPGWPGVVHPRPAFYWPVDALCLAERLVLAGMKAARKPALPVPEDLRAHYIGDQQMLVSMAFEECLGLWRLASAGIPASSGYGTEAQEVRYSAGQRGIARLFRAIDHHKESYLVRVQAGEVPAVCRQDIPERPLDGYDDDRLFPLGQKLFVVLSLEEGHALMTFAGAGAANAPLEWEPGIPDKFHQEAGQRAIAKIYDAGMERIRRHRACTGFPGWIWGTAYSPLNTRS
jgi:ADP-ribosyl-[dinitrogen reductase] hydrolase